jgi:glycosyltransferase involved in cell wall biosynthesis
MTKLSVGFDREIFMFQRFGGISKYFSELILGFESMGELEISPKLTFSRTNNLHLRSAVQESGTFSLGDQRYFFQPKNWVTTAITYGPIRSLNSLWAGGATNKTQLDLLHATYYRPELLEKSKGKKLAVTLHDFIPEKLGWLGLRNPHIGKYKLARMADLIICVSKQTAEDLDRFYGISDERVVVIPHGSHPQNSNAKRLKPQKVSILYVGHRRGYKNFRILPEALSLIRKNLPDFELVIAGPVLDPIEISELERLVGKNNWRSVVNPTDKLLEELYLDASFHVVTSLMEGFGMTILESMSKGTPVIASDINVFHEVGGIAVKYFDPASSDQLASLILEQVNQIEDSTLSTLSLARSQQLTWEITAAKHAHAYQRAINQ